MVADDVGRRQLNDRDLADGNLNRGGAEHADAAGVATRGCGTRRGRLTAIRAVKRVGHRQKGKHGQQAGGENAAHGTIITQIAGGTVASTCARKR